MSRRCSSIVGRNAERTRKAGRSHVVRLPAAADALLDLAHAGEILVELAAVGCAQRLAKSSRVLGDEVEDALGVPIPLPRTR